MCLETRNTLYFNRWLGLFTITMRVPILVYNVFLHIVHTQNIHKHSSKNYTIEKCLTGNGLSEWMMLSELYPEHNLLILHSSLEEQDEFSPDVFRKTLSAVQSNRRAVNNYERFSIWRIVVVIKIIIMIIVNDTDLCWHLDWAQ